MGVDWNNEREILEEFASQKGEGTWEDYEIITEDAAEDQDVFAPSGVIGACIKQGRSDGFVELGGLAYYASSSSTEVYIGEGYKSWKAAVKYIGRKG